MNADLDRDHGNAVAATPIPDAPEASAHSPALLALIAEYEAWGKTLPPELQHLGEVSASDAICELEGSEEGDENGLQPSNAERAALAWLRDFVVRWEAVEDAEADQAEIDYEEARNVLPAEEFAKVRAPDHYGDDDDKGVMLKPAGKDHGCSCGRPSCTYDEVHGNTLRDQHTPPRADAIDEQCARWLVLHNLFNLGLNDGASLAIPATARQAAMLIGTALEVAADGFDSDDKIANSYNLSQVFFAIADRVGGKA
jgi:hypothetical protein